MRVNPSVHPEVFLCRMSFLLQPFLFPDFGTGSVGHWLAYAEARLLTGIHVNDIHWLFATFSPGN